MATNVKTAISLQEDLFKEVNRLANDLHVSRSKQIAIRSTRPASSCVFWVFTKHLTSCQVSC